MSLTKKRGIALEEVIGNLRGVMTALDVLSESTMPTSGERDLLFMLCNILHDAIQNLEGMERS